MIEIPVLSMKGLDNDIIEPVLKVQASATMCHSMIQVSTFVLSSAEDVVLTT